MIQPDKFFYLLSDETRLRCLSLLHQNGELCVCDLCFVLDMVQPKISRHLAILKKFKMVMDRRDGIWIYYRIHPTLPDWVIHVLSNTLIGICKQEPYVSDSNKYSEKTASLCD